MRPPDVAARRDYTLGPRFPGPGFGVLLHVLDLHPQGTAVEFGVGCGRTLQIIAAQLPAVGFDSFQGLPEDWRDGYPKGTFACSPPVIDNAQIVAGWFADTLPVFDFTAIEPIGLVHFDADLYSSTATALRYVGPHLHSGCYVVFDEWHGYPGYENGEQRAWREYAQRTHQDWEVIGCSDQEWAVRLV